MPYLTAPTPFQLNFNKVHYKNKKKQKKKNNETKQNKKPFFFSFANLYSLLILN